MKKTLKTILLFALVVLSTLCFAVGCGGEGGDNNSEPTPAPHTHVFDKQVVEDAYLKEAATCTIKAKYYYSCGCGEKGEETFEYGYTLGHNYGEWASNGDNTHTRVCVNDITHKEAENCKGGTATCTEQAKCAVCGESYGSTLEHQYTELKYNQTEHWYECKCGDKATAEGHKGGAATCKEKAKCEVCGEEYGELVGHSFTIYTYNNDAKCEIDGTEMAKCDYGCGTTHNRTKEGSALEHNYNQYISNEDGTHYKVCLHNDNHKIMEDCTIVNEECQYCGYASCIESLVFTLNSAGTEYSVTGYIGTEESVTVPKKYKSKPVTSIGNAAFSNCRSLTSVTIGNSVTSIGFGAFSGCNSLQSLTLPFVGDAKTGASKTHFGYIFGASRYQDNRSYVPISLKKVVITDETSIERYAFYQSTSITHIEILNTKTRIRQSAFYGCNSLQSIALPFINIGFQGNSGTHLGYIFAADGDSQNDFVPTSLKTVVINGGTNIGDYTFSYCESLTNIVIGNSITSIGYMAFFGCNSLTSISIGDNVTSIGDEAFDNCNNLQYNVEGNLKYLGNDENKYHYLIGAISKDITNATINDKCKVIGREAFYSCDSLTSIVIPDSVTSIGDGAFYYCRSLTSIVIPDSVTNIGSYAFDSCASLTSIEIPNSVTSIGDGAFYWCKSLTSVTIGNKVTSVGDHAFDGCTSLTSIEIPNSVTSIGDGAFYGCKNLQYNIEGNLKYLGNSENKYLYLAETTSDYITSANINSKCKFIGSYAFDSCASLTSIEIPNSVTSIDEYAFSGCTSLTSVTIGDSVTSIGKYAFSNCTSLTSVTIGDSVTSIDNYVFYRCTKLKSIVFEDTTTWYRVYGETDWENKAGGTYVSVTNASSNATYFKSTYVEYYWYKK